jgi:hypothetical protein
VNILIAGLAGSFAERLLALRDAGHEMVYCTLESDRSPDDFRNADIPYFVLRPRTAGADIHRIVSDFQIDVIYSLKNSWDGSSELVDFMLDGENPPIVRHYKEHSGRWEPLERRTLTRTAGQVYINEESLEHFRRLYQVDLGTAHLLDTDYLPARYVRDDLQPKCFEHDQRPHLLVPGSVSASGGRTDIRSLCQVMSRRHIHVHIYGNKFIGRDEKGQWRAGDVRVYHAYRPLLDDGFVHFHDTVEASRLSYEWSRYDAGLMHVASRDPEETAFQRMNQPNRVACVLSAGLPLAQQRGGQDAMERLVGETGAGFLFGDYAELADILEDRRVLGEASRQSLCVRQDFTFESRLPELIAILARYAQDSKLTPMRRTV